MVLVVHLRWLLLFKKVRVVWIFRRSKQETYTETVGFNMENQFAIFVTYLAHLLNGNLVTDLLSIGGKSKNTGPDPPPAHAGGFNVHGTFEGRFPIRFSDEKHIERILKVMLR